MNDERRNFDKEAASWDEKPLRIKLAKEIARAIVGHITLRPDMDVLDFGCGTGLLTLELQPLVRSITGVDSSPGMLEVFRKKIAAMQPGNVKTGLLDVEKGDSLTGKYHLVVSSMALHHVKNIHRLLAQFHHVLVPSGLLCIADLDSEDGLFHDDNTGVFHPGFDRPELRRLFTDAGFHDVGDSTATTMEKQTPDGSKRRFTVFLMTGRNG
jgi:ubiquinone/menaquinone biosynthesis C-methylase UbiE